MLKQNFDNVTWNMPSAASVAEISSRLENGGRTHTYTLVSRGHAFGISIDTENGVVSVVNENGIPENEPGHGGAEDNSRRILAEVGLDSVIMPAGKMPLIFVTDGQDDQALLEEIENLK